MDKHSGSWVRETMIQGDGGSGCIDGGSAFIGDGGSAGISTETI